MGWFTHLITLGAGIFIGTRITQRPEDQSGEPWIRVNTSGVRMGTRDVVKITNDRVDFWDGTVHIDRKRD